MITSDVLAALRTVWDAQTRFYQCISAYSDAVVRHAPPDECLRLAAHCQASGDQLDAALLRLDHVLAAAEPDARWHAQRRAAQQQRRTLHSVLARFTQQRPATHPRPVPQDNG